MRKRFKSSGWLFVMIPTFLAVISGITNYATVTFGVYLKYQAMIDTYYTQVIIKNEEEIMRQQAELKQNKADTKVEQSSTSPSQSIQ